MTTKTSPSTTTSSLSSSASLSSSPVTTYKSTTATTTTAPAYKIPLAHKLVVGGFAGLIGVTSTFPIDVIKTHLQTQGQNASLFRTIRSIVGTYGIRGFYHGLPPTCIGILPEKAIKLAFNDYFCELFMSYEQKHSFTPVQTLSFPKQIVAAGLAGTMQVIATNPMEIIKIRLQTHANRNMVEAVKELGLRGMYKGTSSTLCRDAPYAMIFFPTYAFLKQTITTYVTNGQEKMAGILVAGGIAGATASAFVTPFDMIKTRRQLKGANIGGGTLGVAMDIVKKEGVSTLMNGAVPRMFVQAPLFAITLLAFELQKKYMTNKYGKAVEE